MSPSRLKIDTKPAANADPSSSKLSARDPRSRSPLPSPRAGSHGTRLRSTSNASTSSSLSIVSPKSSSTNASTTSLLIPTASHTRGRNLRSRSPSPSSPVYDDTVRPGPEYVLAMHDYSPQTQNATCLSFRAGQVIHVLNRDSSGWWDGELEGRRGWFPSNYVNADVPSLTDEELPSKQPVSLSFISWNHLQCSLQNGRHTHSMSSNSAASWVSSTSREYPQRQRRPSISEALGQEIDSYCPPLMVPLLHGLSLLQTAVRANRPSHFPPSTACIISCVREILSATDTLLRDAPILQQFPLLAQERRKILSVLASLVAQAKKAAEENVDEEKQEFEVESMLRLGGQVFAHVRRFLAVAVQCGVELPGQRQSTASSLTETEGKTWHNRASSFETSSEPANFGSLDDQTPTQNRQREREILATQGSALRAKSTGDLRSRARTSIDDDSDGVPLLPNRPLPAKSKQLQYLIRDRALSRHKSGLASVSSTSSSSSFSSQDSAPAAPFPCGPSKAAQVIEALRSTHDQYLSTIAAFIGHAHSHSRSSHASSTGHLYDLVREIVEMVCKLLTIVEAVMNHPDVPTHRLGNLKSAKEGLYNVTSSLAESVRLLTLALPSILTEEEEKQTLLRSATGALKAGADCVAAVKMCLNRSVGDRPFIINLPPTGDRGHLFTPGKFSQPPLQKSISMGALQGYRSNGVDDEDLTIQAVSPSPVRKSREASSGSDNSRSSAPSDDTNPTSPDEDRFIPSLTILRSAIEPDFPSPTSLNRTDEDGTTWEGSSSKCKSLEDKIVNGNLPIVPLEPIPEFIQDPMAWMLSHDYSLDEVAYNSEGHLVGATMEVLVEKMTPHDSIVDPAFSAVFFLTFRLFSSPTELVDAIIARYNLVPPQGISNEDEQVWQQRKGIPVRLRVSNFIKIWVDMYWRPGVDDTALSTLTTFTRDGLALFFPGPAQRILELINMRRQSNDPAISPKGDRSRDPGMSINPPTTVLQTSEVPRPTMTKTLLVALRKKDFASISVTDFDALELARQLTIMECNLYCAIQPEEVLETGQEDAKPPVNVRAVSSLSTVITGWVAESILNEPDIKKRTLLIKFFIKVADVSCSIYLARLFFLTSTITAMHIIAQLQYRTVNASSP
jgi:son of sevenless